MSQLHYRGAIILGSALSLAAIAACNNGTPSSLQPSSQPLITASTTGSPADASGTSAASDTAGVTFRDDFTGSVLDSTRWLAFPQTGLVDVHDGLLDVLSPGAQPNFPYVVTKDVIIPQSGPFFFETTFTRLSPGTVPAFCLDYLPAVAPNVPPLTKPFMLMGADGLNLDLYFNTETSTTQPKFIIPNSNPLRISHRIRVEFDGQNHYRVIADHTEIGTFQSARRPMKFWIGHNPPQDVGAGDWGRLNFDYVEAGVLTAPDPAAPPSTATATASP